MKLVSFRDLRNTPGRVRTMLQDQDVVLTSNGNPIAIVMPVSGDLEEALAVVRRVRAQAAVSRMRKQAAASGRSSMTAPEIEEEIQAARRQRRT